MAQVSTVVNYFMEDPREASRLEQKVDPKAWMKKYLEPHLSPSAEVLCVGCGPGTILRAVSNAYPKVNGTGIDISASRIQVAKENNIRNSRLRFFTGDAHQMQFASASFDLVYS